MSTSRIESSEPIGRESSESAVRSHNRRAWDLRVAHRNPWTIPVTSEEVARARKGDFDALLTPEPVPRDWLGDLYGKRVLGLAAGGGQQGPLLAAAGADVTVVDLSPAQLAQDRDVAAREGLALTTVEGDMRDLSAFDDATFDIVFHPVANLYVENVRVVWREAHRVLRNGGVLLAGFYNPMMCVFDEEKMDEGVLEVAYQVPFSDLTSISDKERAELVGEGHPLVFGHSLQDQLGGQTEAGFAITGFVESGRGQEHLPDRFMPTYIATRAVKI